ncbi:hypothetical protein [Nonomuraea sp. B19D2]|uniref:hypothetical protein n=1 Tax=Nonomuraea sp. B19D2 TaxID=3159561 RepID=UPI0032D9E366
MSALAAGARAYRARAFTAARRRTYELAALEASGARVAVRRAPGHAAAAARGRGRARRGRRRCRGLLAAVLVSEALLRGIRVERLRDAPS